MRTEPNVCPIHNTPVFHARRAFGCECKTCQGPAEREAEPEAEAEAKQAEAERQAEEVREAMVNSYNAGGRTVEGGHVPSAAVEDVSDVIEGN